MFAEELLRWNKNINLTSITVMEEVVEKHLLDSLVLVRLLGKNTRILDVGSGAGLPVIPLAMVMKNSNFFSVDSVGKKINFQKHIKRTLHLPNLEIQCARIEELKRTSPGWLDFDVVIARAVAHTGDLIKMAMPVIRTEGMLIAMKGPEGKEELATLENNWGDDCLLPLELITYQLPFSGAERNLIRIVKTQKNEK